MNKFLVLLVSLVSVWVSEVSATNSTVNFAALQGLGNPDYHQVKSLDGKRSYHVFVRYVKTDSKTDDSSKKYPTVYMLDGGVTYPLLSGLYHYMRYTDEIPKMNLVAISYGADSFKHGNYRASDYTVKSAERDYWGGAGEFVKLFKQSIIPMVENNYPADADKRILFGQSLGGQFAIYTSMHHQSLFHGYIASNPALHRNLDFFMQPVKAVNNKAKSKLYVGVGSNDHPTYKVPATKWLKHIQSQKQSELLWQFKTETLPAQTHVSAAPEAFRRGVNWILSD